jgi:glycosyltransferase involved in cell wall biosynthesis
MRVLHLHSGNLFGGVETFLAALARFRALCPGLAPEFALFFEGRIAEVLRAQGVPVHLLHPVRASRPWTILRARGVLRRLLRERRYDVALCHSPWSEAMVGPEMRRAGVPLAFFLHDAANGRHWVDRWARLTPPDVVLCNSRFTASTLPRLFPRVRSEVLHPLVAPQPPPEAGARERVRAELGAKDGEAVVIQTSRMEGWKGHRLHLEALGLLREEPGWSCWMVGGAQRPHEREYLASLERRVAELGLGGRVRFLGQRSDVPALLAAADLHCQPNLGPEPFGITFVEALAAGLPVVTTAMGGGLEIVDERCGFTVPPDSGALAAVLRRLIQSPDLRRRLGEAGPARARALCDPAARLLDLQRVLGTVARSD